MIALALLALLLALPLPVQAAPIIFDFEDGLQGWELSGSAQRVQTQILGGEWAIFGDGLVGSPFMSIEVDVTNIVSISVDRFLVEGDEDGLSTVVAGANPTGNGGLVGFFGFEVIDATNPNLLAVNVGSLVTGVGRVEIRWHQFASDVFPATVAFIDNITFHPVPEPGTLALLAGSLAALLVAHRRVM